MLFFVLTWLLSPILRARVRAGEASAPNILLMQTAKIGDLICTTPVIASLRASWPGAKITVMVAPGCAPLLQNDPAIDALWPLKPAAWRGAWAKLKLAAEMRWRRFDISICLSPNTALMCLPLWAGVPVRAAMLGNFESRSTARAARFLTHAERHQSGRLVLDTELALLKKLGCAALTREKKLHPSEQAHALAGTLVSGPAIGVGISSGNKLKALSEEQLRALCARLLQTTDATLVLVGSLDDHDLAMRLQTALGSARVVSAAGAFALDELPALVARFAVYFGVDSGITYMADAMGVPVIDAMGPANADDQRPTGAKAIVLRPALPCAPCSHAFRAPYHCATGTRACVADLQAAQLAALVTDTYRSAPQPQPQPQPQ